MTNWERVDAGEMSAKTFKEKLQEYRRELASVKAYPDDHMWPPFNIQAMAQVPEKGRYLNSMFDNLASLGDGVEMIGLKQGLETEDNPF
jgi:hypothetical protein